MKKGLIIGALCFVVVSGMLVANFAMAQSQKNETQIKLEAKGWNVDAIKAMEEAKKEDKKVLFFFNAGLTQKADSNYYNDFLNSSDFNEFAKKNVVLVSIDLNEIKKDDSKYKEQYIDIMRKYGIYQVPMVVMADNDGTKLGTIRRTKSANPYIKALERTLIPLNWQTDFEAAKKMAKKEKKPMFLLFTGSDWCPYCFVIEEEIINTTKFREYASENLIMVYLDFPNRFQLSEELTKQNEKLAGVYGVGGFPTVVMTNADGKMLGVAQRTDNPKSFIKNIEKVSK